jgi:hypothetical protein
LNASEPVRRRSPSWPRRLVDAVGVRVIYRCLAVAALALTLCDLSIALASGRGRLVRT